MKNLSPKVFFIVAMAYLVGGCSTWKDGERYTNPVWSVDEKSVAAVFETFEYKPNFWSLGGVNYERDVMAQVVVTDFDPSKPKQLTKKHHIGPILEGRTRMLYLQKDYVLVRNDGEAQDAADGSELRQQIWTRVNLDGTSKTLFKGKRMTMLSCDGGNSSSSLPVPELGLYPSPNGKYIALVEGDVSCKSASASLKVLDAKTMKALTPTHGVKLGSLDSGYWPIMNVFWTADSSHVYLAQSIGPPDTGDQGYKLNAATGKLSQVSKIPFACVWQPYYGGAQESQNSGYLSVSSDGKLETWKSTDPMVEGVQPCTL